MRFKYTKYRPEDLDDIDLEDLLSRPPVAPGVPGQRSQDAVGHDRLSSPSRCPCCADVLLREVGLRPHRRAAAVAASRHARDDQGFIDAISQDDD